MNRHRQNKSRGASLVEIVVAASLILVVLVAASSTFTSSERSLARTVARDAASVAAANLLEQSALFGCQTRSDPETAKDLAPVCESLRTLAVTGSLGTSNAPSTSAGDGVFEVNVPDQCVLGQPGCRRYAFTISSRWIRSDEDASACTDRGAVGGPSLLERRVRVVWQQANDGEPILAEYVSASTRPDGSAFTDSSSYGVLVLAPPDTPVLLTDRSDESLGIVRLAAPCTADGATTGEAWFPYLPRQGTYRVRALTVLDPTAAASRALFAAEITGDAAAASGVDVASPDCGAQDQSCVRLTVVDLASSLDRGGS